MHVISAVLACQSSKNFQRLKYYTYKFDPEVNVARVIVTFLFLRESGHGSFQQCGEVALLSSLREGLLCPLNIPVKDRTIWGLKMKPLRSKNSTYFTVYNDLPIPNIKWIISLIHSQFRLKGPGETKSHKTSIIMWKLLGEKWSNEINAGAVF